MVEIASGNDGDHTQYPHAISGACCTVIDDHLYVFGGWVSGLRTADVHELNLASLIWRKLEPTNQGEGPFLKDKAGMVSYGNHMLCVFGGYGYPGHDHISLDGVYRHQKGASYAWDRSSFHEICWTNELHLLDIKTRKVVFNAIMNNLNLPFCIVPQAHGSPQRPQGHAPLPVPPSPSPRLMLTVWFCSEGGSVQRG